MLLNAWPTNLCIIKVLVITAGSDWFHPESFCLYVSFVCVRLKGSPHIIGHDKAMERCSCGRCWVSVFLSAPSCLLYALRPLLHRKVPIIVSGLSVLWAHLSTLHQRTTWVCIDPCFLTDHQVTTYKKSQPRRGVYKSWNINNWTQNWKNTGSSPQA